VPEASNQVADRSRFKWLRRLGAMSRRFRFREPEPGMTDADVHFSRAPLTQIQSASTFHDMGSGACGGIIFHYGNDGERAVGQCRLGVNKSKIVSRPSVLCFQATWAKYCAGPLDSFARVEATADVSHQHTGAGWKCGSLGNGVLMFSFTHRSSRMVIPKESSTPAC